MGIVLATLNSRYSHASLALRALYANLNELQDRAQILEFTISQPPDEIAQKIIAAKPHILGLGVYIWNTTQTLALLSILKERTPHLIVVLGGPEVSYESESQEICSKADYVIQGEGDFAFVQLCRDILAGAKSPKFIRAQTPDVASLASPYPWYTDEDVHQRNLYVEASRGCPYTCEFCLSSLDQGVRHFPLPNFFADLQNLLDRGARQFKFIDRTFNLNPKISIAILQFFLERMDLGLFLHFEMVPDRLPDALKNLIRQFPQGALQFEIGIQTWNLQVATLISRRQNYAKTQENLHFLLRQTHVYVHADLIAGLPGEDERSFAQGFDRLAAFQPHEIQVGLLKRLKGTAITRHDQNWGMVYDTKPPFQILQTQNLTRESLKRIERFSKFWDRIANSGRFPHTLRVLRKTPESFYARFMELSEFLYARLQRTHSIDLSQLGQLVADFLTEHLGLEENLAQKIIAQDLCKPPACKLAPSLPKRQRAHLSNLAPT